MNSTTLQKPGRIHHGPSPGVVAVVYMGLFLASLVTVNIMTGGARIPRPSDSLEQIREYYLHFAKAIQVVAFLQFGSAIPLGIFAATMSSRLRFHGISAAGVDIAAFGGAGASLMIVLSGCCTWILSQPGVIDNLQVMHTIQLFGFSFGGAGHVVMLGLLIAGIAVTTGFTRLMPKWLVWSGIIIALFSELSSLSFLIAPAALFIPLGRYLGFFWLIGAGLTLPRYRPPGHETIEIVDKRESIG